LKDRKIIYQRGNLWTGLFLLSNFFILRHFSGEISEIVESKYGHGSVITWIISLEILLLAILTLLSGLYFPHKKERKSEEKGKPELTPELKLKALLAQYNQLWTEIREFSKEMWQVPSVVGVLNSLFLGVAITSKEDILISFPMVATALFLTFTFTIALHKHRFFAESKFSTRKRVEKILRDKYGAIEIFHGTESVHNAIEMDKIEVLHKGWWTKRRAFDWLFISMYLMLALISIVAIWLFI